LLLDTSRLLVVNLRLANDPFGRTRTWVWLGFRFIRSYRTARARCSTVFWPGPSTARPGSVTYRLGPARHGHGPLSAIGTMRPGLLSHLDYFHRRPTNPNTTTPTPSQALTLSPLPFRLPQSRTGTQRRSPSLRRRPSKRPPPPCLPARERDTTSRTSTTAVGGSCSRRARRRRALPLVDERG
jgi:hypothetical protein